MWVGAWGRCRGRRAGRSSERLLGRGSAPRRSGRTGRPSAGQFTSSGRADACPATVSRARAEAGQAQGGISVASGAPAGPVRRRPRRAEVMQLLRASPARAPPPPSCRRCVRQPPRSDGAGSRGRARRAGPFPARAGSSALRRHGARPALEVRGASASTVDGGLRLAACRGAQDRAAHHVLELAHVAGPVGRTSGRDAPRARAAPGRARAAARPCPRSASRAAGCRRAARAAAAPAAGTPRGGNRGPRRKRPRSHLALEVAVGRGDRRARPPGARWSRADALDLAALQRAQQLGLQRRAAARRSRRGTACRRRRPRTCRRGRGRRR